MVEVPSTAPTHSHFNRYHYTTSNMSAGRTRVGWVDGNVTPFADKVSYAKNRRRDPP